VTIDILAHEFFHYFQHKLRMFHIDIWDIRGGRVPTLRGEPFIEGSAICAESLVVDVLAIRGAMKSTNIRLGGDE
jgi:hypothetical protein